MYTHFHCIIHNIVNEVGSKYLHTTRQGASRLKHYRNLDVAIGTSTVGTTLRVDMRDKWKHAHTLLKSSRRVLITDTYQAGGVRSAGSATDQR